MNSISLSLDSRDSGDPLRQTSGGFRGWVRRPENMGAISIAALVLILHLVALFQVKDYIFDEAAAVIEANYILYGEDIDPFYLALFEKGSGVAPDEYLDRGYTQGMPLGKLFFAASIGVLGDNVWGWRMGPVLAGVVSIILFYLICQNLTSKRWLPLIATFVFAFENMCFVMAGIALLDVYSFTLMLAAFLLYLRGHYLPAGVFIGLSALAKVIGAFGGGVILLHWLLTRRKSVADAGKFVIAAPLTFLALMPLLDYIAVNELMYPWDRIRTFFDIHADSSLANAPGAYRAIFTAFLPWEWLTSPGSIGVWRDPSYEFNVNWILWPLIIPLMAYMLYEAIRKRGDSLCLYAVIWFACGYLPWFLAYLVLDRVSYPIYFYPVIPAVCLAAGYVIYRVWGFASLQADPLSRWAVRAPAMLWLAAYFAMFWMMAPIA